jgi:hypothetical protein
MKIKWQITYKDLGSNSGVDKHLRLQEWRNVDWYIGTHVPEEVAPNFQGNKKK